MALKETLKKRLPFLVGIKHKPAMWKERVSYLATPKLTQDAFNDTLAQRIREQQPSCICRIGSVELSALRHYILKPDAFWDAKGQTYMHTLFTNAGVYPNNAESYLSFCRVYIDSLQDADVTGIWYNPGEHRVLKQYAKASSYTQLTHLEPYYTPNPWTIRTAGLRVLVVTPFAKTAEQQCAHLTKIWPQYNGLFPEASFTFIKAPAHASMVEPEHDTWCDALDALKGKIDQVEYDVLIVGAGAWGLPLAVHAKRRGKIGYHLGGATQLLFGIQGRRWDNHPLISKLYNAHWIRPLSEEIPEKCKLVEEGCYW
jgi:hypothetical protein